MRDYLVFYINGTRHTVAGHEAVITLTDFLRNRCGNSSDRLTGTKVACAEGDCGACTVLVGKPSSSGDRFEYRSIDACIGFVYQFDRCHIITVEGIQQEDQLSAIQSAMVNCHGSQCGFCTPGFVMALHGLVEDHCHAEAQTLSEDDLRSGLSGNLCRCTGYEQILEAGRSLKLHEMDPIENRYDASAMLAEFSKLAAQSVHINPRPAIGLNGTVNHSSTEGSITLENPPEIFLPTNLPDLLARRVERPEAILVAGATDLGVQYNHGKISPQDVILTLNVDELHQLEIINDELVIGAAVAWSQIEAFTKVHVPEYYAILNRFGSPQVRNAGTLAGNLANASPIADSIPFHFVSGTKLELASESGMRFVPMEDFYLGYKKLDLKQDEVIVRIHTPLPTATERLKLYKISKRRDMDISTVTTAFLLEFDGNVVTQAKIAAGGVGPTVIRLPQAESHLLGQEFTSHTMRVAGQIARQEIAPISDVRGSAEFRLQLVENLFVKCFHDLTSPSVAIGV